MLPLTFDLNSRQHLSVSPSSLSAVRSPSSHSSDFSKLTGVIVFLAAVTMEKRHRRSTQQSPKQKQPNLLSEMTQSSFA